MLCQMCHTLYKSQNSICFLIMADCLYPNRHLRFSSINTQWNPNLLIFYSLCLWNVFFSCLFLQSVDWWSLGILMFELLTGASPFTLEGERNSQSEVSKWVIQFGVLSFSACSRHDYCVSVVSCWSANCSFQLTQRTAMAIVNLFISKTPP